MPNKGATDPLGFNMISGCLRYAYGCLESDASLKRIGSLWSSEASGENANHRLVRFDRKDVRRNTVP
ncbi:MAG: hypothetical protein GW809_02130 [Bacteroidetes bacterium]|nr:hypothetical protein [Bacteroidota bacterium]